MAWESAGLRIRRENQRGEETFRLNGNNSINLLSVKENDTFSDVLKGRNYKMTVGYFYGPSDNPFSFSAGFYIAFNSIYLVEATQFTIIGFNTNGIMESKFVNLK